MAHPADHHTFTTRLVLWLHTGWVNKSKSKPLDKDKKLFKEMVLPPQLDLVLIIQKKMLFDGP